MTILGHMKRTGVRSGALLLALLWTRQAAAEIVLVERDGWTFTADGQVGAFLSYTFGENFPPPNAPTNVTAADPSMPLTGSHVVLGDTPIASRPSGFGFGSGGGSPHKQANGDNEFNMFRVRSGAFPNILGFGLAHAVTEETTAAGHIRIWAPTESLGRDAWYALQPDLREAYLDVEGGWGKFRAGRTFKLIGRMSWEIDNEYAHQYTHGLPCSDDIGPTCGQVGAGALHPGFGAGLIYTTPSLGGLTLDLGLFDPVSMAVGGGAGFPRATVPRPELALAYEIGLGATGLLKFGAEGAYQPVSQVQSDDHDGDPATPNEAVESKDAIWGVSGGFRLEVGPARFGAAAFHGRGIGLYYAFHATSVTVGPAVEPYIDPTTGMPSGQSALDTSHYELREFTGAHGQLAFVFGPAQVGVGAGAGMVGALESDEINIGLSAPKQQIGVSVTAVYHVSDNVALGLDYMRLMASWQGVPEHPVDDAGMVVPTTPNGATAVDGTRREGETQAVNFVNAGITYHW